MVSAGTSSRRKNTLPFWPLTSSTSIPNDPVAGTQINSGSDLAPFGFDFLLITNVFTIETSGLGVPVGQPVGCYFLTMVLVFLPAAASAL